MLFFLTGNAYLRGLFRASSIEKLWNLRGRNAVDTFVDESRGTAFLGQSEISGMVNETSRKRKVSACRSAQ